MPGEIAVATARAGRYLDGLAARPVAPTPAALDNLARFAQPLQDHPIEPAQVVQELDEFGSPATVATAGGRFFGFVIGGSLPAALAANVLAAAWDQNAVLEVASPIGAELEKVSRGWLVTLLGLPARPRSDLSRALRWRTSPGWPLRGIRCSSGRAGTWRAKAFSLRHPSR